MERTIMIQVNSPARDVQVKLFAGEYAARLEVKINDWLAQVGRESNPEIISVAVNEIGHGYFSAVIAYRPRGASGE
ncbi:MAG: hypothetical protein K2Y32_20455 [Candidatus Obscuribacterales bacterium]|nr:hypothetical protein [Candidatus Obscuribacterales bacterium]